MMNQVHAVTYIHRVTLFELQIIARGGVHYAVSEQVAALVEIWARANAAYTTRPGVWSRYEVNALEDTGRTLHDILNADNPVIATVRESALEAISNLGVRS